MKLSINLLALVKALLTFFALLATGLITLVIWSAQSTNCGERVDEVFVQYGVNPALMAYRLTTGDYPTTEEGLHALLECPPGKEATWKGPYIEKEAIDPWMNPYQYRYPGIHNIKGYDLWSLGADGVVSNDDARNWK